MNNVLERSPAKADKVMRYGETAQQFAELRFPDGLGPKPLLFVIHGGFWRNLYDLSHISHLCAALTRIGIVTCNLEYRRVGDPGGGWPGTFQDIVLGTDRVMREMGSDKRVDMGQVAVLGHSAGAHLALWLASRKSIPKESELHNISKHYVTTAIALAGVCDLREAWHENLGRGAVDRFLGGSPAEHPDRYRAASPIELLPSGSGHVLVHGIMDDIVPVSQSEKFVDRAIKLGDHPRLVRAEGIGHFELIDPESNGWDIVEKAVTSLIQPLAE